jgi:hypothetical protein
MVYVLVEKLMELIRDLYTTEVDDEIVYTSDEYRYNDDDYESID